ncbi:hypothetical protein G9A89_023832 [Geosiphon pyriformis]|nr:hypothetical protein G9A89_023832 [Geosiphon pyriformis]
MELVGFAAGGSGSVSAGLGTWSSVKNKCSVGLHSHSASYKKPKKPVAVDGLVESSADVSNVIDKSGDGSNIRQSWASKVNSEVNSMSGVSGLDNMENVIAKETCYAESDVSGLDDNINDAMPRKTCTRTYVLNSKPPPLSFNVSSDDIELSAVPGKTNNDKMISLKKIFYRVDGFGGASTPSKFSGIIRSSFTSEISLNKARELAICEKILVNNNLRKSSVCSDREVIVKEIPVDLPKSAIEEVFSKFGKIISIKVQLISLWQKALVEYESSEMADLVTARWSVFMGKDSVHMAKANIDKQTDQHQALLYTLPVGTNAHDLSSLLESYGGKTCYIGRNPSSYVRDRCAVICFGDEASKLAAIGTIPVFKNVSLHWAGFSLASCIRCKQFGHVMVNCSLGEYSGVRGRRVVSEQDRIRLAEIYKKKSVPVACPVSLGGKTWAQVAGGSPSCMISSGLVGTGLHSGSVPFSMATVSPTISHLNDQLAILEHSLELLTDCISGILAQLESINLVSVVTPSLSLLSVVSETLSSDVVSDIILDTALVSSGTLPSVFHDAAVELSSSSSKVLTAKVGGLETKLIALKASVGLVLDKLNILCSGSGMNNPAKQEDIIRWHKDMNNLISIITETKLKGKVCLWIATRFNGVRVFTSGQDSGNLGSGIAIVVNNSLAHHVCKISEVPGWLLLIKMLFKNKLSVSILGLYAGASLATHFSQAGEVNSLIAETVNESSFVVLGGDFNEDGSRRGVVKTIDYVFISSNLVNAIVNRDILDVSEYFDTDHQAVCVSVGLGGLLDVHLNFLCRQTNRDQWKFSIRGADESRWDNFRGATLANAAMFSDKFATTVRFSDLDVMWDVIREIMVLSADGIFKKKWFKDFDRPFSKEFSKFHKLELLVSKIFKVSHEGDIVGFFSFMDCWASLDSVKALVIRNLVDSGMDSGHVFSALSSARKSYRASKLVESQIAKETNIRSAIDKRMKSFEVNKDHTIRSVLERPFHKVVLNYLVVDGELVLEPDQVKSKVDIIMEEWTRKHRVVDDMSSEWCRQYRPLEYVFDEAFSEVMCLIGFDELFGVVSVLPDGKAAGLLGISNELWKHCDRSVLEMLLVLFDKISAACSIFNVLRGDNFSVLKGTTTQSPIFAIGLIIEDALEKNLGWEHFEKCLVRIKMCSKFIWFFGDIHKGCTNRVMMDFSLTGGYHVYDGLDQGEVFFPLLWCIFYDPLLCEVKHQESVCGYRLNSYFISKNGCAETQAGRSSFFATGAFVDDTIWVGNSQAATQHILNINDISINNTKTVAIPINSRVSSPSLSINGSPISIARKGESHQYLGIFFSTEGFSKSSLAKAHLDICFFVNLVLRKTISDKQFLYLVLVVLQPIISYRTQFSFISVGVCAKWDALVCKGLKLKSGLLLDFPNDTLYHPSFYGLKSFSQVQSECKMASLISFVNFDGILGCLFSHRSHDLQVQCWHPIYPLNSPVHVNISTSNNFLADLVRILLDCNLSLGKSFVSSFRSSGSAPMSTVLGESRFSKFLPSLRWYGVVFVDQLCNHHGAIFDWYIFKRWKRLDPRGPVPEWFRLAAAFLNGASLPFNDQLVSDSVVYRDILGSADYASVVSGSLSVYTDGSLGSLGTAECRAGAAVFFEDIGLGLGVGVLGLMSSILVELQAIALAMEYVPSSCSICVFSDSQSALSACESELNLVCPDFHNQCWVEHQHIANVICSKNLRVCWHKVKGHSGVSGNEHADEIAGIAFFSSWHLHPYLNEHFLVADSGVVLGNLKHFVRDICQSICRARWEVGSGAKFLRNNLLFNVDWFRSSLVWHPDLHMATSSTSRPLANAHTYFMKALYHWLPVAVRKHLYNIYYPSVLCLYCGDVESSDHVFFCKVDNSACSQILNSHVAFWKALTGLLLFLSVVMQLLSSCASDSPVFMALYKSFVFNDWFCKAVSAFRDPKIAELEMVKFVHSLSLAFRDGVWLVCAKHRAYMEKTKLIPSDGSTPVSVSGLVSGFSAGVVKLLGITETMGVRFGFCKPCLFFSGIGSSVSVCISV